MTDLPPSAEIILPLIRAQPGILRSELLQITGLPTRTARFALKRLIDAKLVLKRQCLPDARLSRYFPIEVLNMTKTPPEMS